MSLYPIISKYYIDYDMLTLTDPKNYSTEKPTIEYKTGQNIVIKRNYFSYGVNYKYDRLGFNEFCLMTQFLKIVAVPTQVKNQIHFSVDITNNPKLKGLIFAVFEKIKSAILQLKPNLLPANIVLPVLYKNMTVDGSNNMDNVYLHITLRQFNKKITTPIHYHRTKKQGGGVSTIVNTPLTEFYTELKEEMGLFKFRSYGKKIVTNHAILNQEIPNQATPQMYYEGKFTLCFAVEYLESKIENDVHEYCKINVFAKEVETKYNLSYVKSVLDVDVSTLNSVNIKQPDTLVI